MTHRGFHREGLNISKHPFGRCLCFYKFPSQDAAQRFAEYVMATFKRLAEAGGLEDPDYPDLRFTVNVDVEPFCDGHQDHKLEEMIENSVAQFGGECLGT